MAQKKAGGSTKNGRDSNSKSLGIKKQNNCYINKGSIIIKQNGLKFIAGKNVFYSKNYNIQSSINGFLKVKKKKNQTIVNVIDVY